MCGWLVHLRLRHRALLRGDTSCDVLGVQMFRRKHARLAVDTAVALPASDRHCTNKGAKRQPRPPLGLRLLVLSKHCT